MKHLTTKITFGATLFAASLFVACGDSKVSGSDEQANSVNATINEWLEADTLKAGQDDPIGNIQDMSIYPSIKTENGNIAHPVKVNFESMFCETKESFFAYYITVSDTLVQKNFGVPDTIPATDFKKDCTLEGGVFTEQESAFKGKIYYQCDLKDGTGKDLKYIDPNWKKYAQQIIDICGEPLEEEPSILEE